MKVYLPCVDCACESRSESISCRRVLYQSGDFLGKDGGYNGQKPRPHGSKRDYEEKSVNKILL